MDRRETPEEFRETWPETKELNWSGLRKGRREGG